MAKEKKKGKLEGLQSELCVGRHARKEYQLPEDTEPSNRTVGSTIKFYHHEPEDGEGREKGAGGRLFLVQCDVRFGW